MSPSSFTEHFQRVGFLAYLPGILRCHGVDPLEVILGAGLEAHSLDDPEGTIPYKAMGKLVELAAEKSQCLHIGLEIGAQVRTTSLGSARRVDAKHANLESGIAGICRKSSSQCAWGVVYIFEEGHEAIFGYAVYQPDMSGYDIVCDGAALAAYNLLKELIGLEGMLSHKILLSRSEPSNSTPYKLAFETRPSFNSGQTAIAFPRHLLDKPIHGANAQLRHKVEQQFQNSRDEGNLSLMSQLERELRVALLKGTTSATEIASQLGMNRWTFDRRLAECGLQFQEALNETRYNYTKQLLARTRLPVASIAAIVGFSDPSALTNGFTKRVGVNPSAWRASQKIVRDLFDDGRKQSGS